MEHRGSLRGRSSHNSTDCVNPDPGKSCLARKTQETRQGEKSLAVVERR